MENKYLLKYGNTEITFQLRRSARKTLKISVLPDQSVFVAAPEEVEMDEVHKKLLKKGRWIKNQQQFFQSFYPSTPQREYVSGETHLYLGKQYRLKIVKDDTESIKLINGRFVIRLDNPDNKKKISQLLSIWYLNKAQKRFEMSVKENIAHFKRWDLATPPLVIKKMSKRWGSCTPKGKIILNPEIIKAPPRCIDYVVIHELCHLVHHNHSKAFYDLQSSIMPDWKKWKHLLEITLV